MSDANFAKFKSILKTDGHFVTKARMNLFGHLQNHPALSLKELIKLADSQDQVTVYRNIDLFEKLGIITKLRLGWNTKIELSDKFKHHHHHFTCLRCGRITDLPASPEIEQQIRLLTMSFDFYANDHSLEITGHCNTCKSQSDTI